MTPAFAELVKKIPLVAEIIVSADVAFFDITHSWNIATKVIPSINPEEAELPYPKCVIGIVQDDGSVFAYMFDLTKELGADRPIFRVARISSDGGGRKPDMVACNLIWHRDDRCWETMVDGEIRPNFRKLTLADAKNIAGAIFHFIGQLKTTTLTAHVSKANIANKKRIAKGKKPLFDWHTVEIKPRVQSAPANGEKTGIKHRQHEVRGHWCIRKSTGLKYWRKAHKRGDASLGVVFHDYVVTP